MPFELRLWCWESWDFLPVQIATTCGTSPPAVKRIANVVLLADQQHAYRNPFMRRNKVAIARGLEAERQGERTRGLSGGWKGARGGAGL